MSRKSNGETNEPMIIDDVYNFDAELEDGGEKKTPRGKRKSRAQMVSSAEVKKEFACDLCDRSFSTLGGLKRHSRCCERIKEELVDDAFEMDKVDLVENDRVDGSENNTTSDEYILPTPINDGSNQSKSEETTVTTLMNMKDNCGIMSLIEPGKCDCCGENSDSAHLIGDIECKECSYFFTTEAAFTRHRTIVHDEGDTYCCSKCDVKCPDKKMLKYHLRVHNPNFKPVSCPVCHKEFSRKYHLVRHNMQTGCDGSERPTFPCQVCMRVFTRKDNLREHLRAHAGQTKRKQLYKCEYCAEEFAGMLVLNQHKKYHLGDKPHACDMCDKKFSTSGALKKHRRKHTGERPYECKQCSAKFAAKETLNRHTRIHTGMKPHSCLFCGKSFIQATQLRAHIFHHTGENGFNCDVCGKAFNRRTRLDLHVKYVHEGAQPFNCDKCDKSFIRKEDLARHEILHSGVKAHKCPVCSKGFAMKSSLKVHLLTHTKEPPRSCDECGRAFIRQDCLLRHMRTKHREMLEEIMAEAEKKKLQAQLLAVAAASTTEEENEANDVVEYHTYLPEDALTDSISQLLTLLVDETTLKSFGWPNASIDKLLEAVIKRCGHNPATTDDLPYPDCLRENAKLLFTVVIDDSAVKTLLNNQTVDEVILHVLKLAKP
ncbi:hypothetical protein V9T40_010971 [Parthenolecanium corni]|uniref:C2H2-type domain-containing protein n=1 Tax=Parthenolecanium corni TaxID=536013 RepID=A0AAN9T561_9HEMI